MQQTLRTSFQALWTAALAWADTRINEGRLTGNAPFPGPEPLASYTQEVNGGRRKPLGFAIRIPRGMRAALAPDLPNVEETGDRAAVFTVRLDEGPEILPGANPFAAA
jgi:hypothetical protein